ncbi:MAG: hypothetical protein AAF558_03950 [Verrucomicrobiota bacterium]
MFNIPHGDPDENPDLQQIEPWVKKEDVHQSEISVYSSGSMELDWTVTAMASQERIHATEYHYCIHPRSFKRLQQLIQEEKINLPYFELGQYAFQIDEKLEAEKIWRSIMYSSDDEFDVLRTAGRLKEMIDDRSHPRLIEIIYRDIEKKNPYQDVRTAVAHRRSCFMASHQEYEEALALLEQSPRYHSQEYIRHWVMLRYQLKQVDTTMLDILLDAIISEVFQDGMFLHYVLVAYFISEEATQAQRIEKLYSSNQYLGRLASLQIPACWTLLLQLSGQSLKPALEEIQRLKNVEKRFKSVSYGMPYHYFLDQLSQLTNLHRRAFNNDVMREAWVEVLIQLNPTASREKVIKDVEKLLKRRW